MKLEKIYKIHAKLECVTGLHIGGSDTEMHIGGVDNQVIKNSVEDLPYVPGSSLKGKIRSLMEWRTGMVQSEPLTYKDLERAGSEKELVKNVLYVLRLFGVGGGDKVSEEKMEEIGPARLSFWDCPINRDWLNDIYEKNLLPVEVKTENSIDRIKGTAKNPRQTERVPAGAIFDFNLTVRILDIDIEDELITEVLRGLKLLELDALGGSGSRGYGKVKFCQLEIEGYDGPVSFENVKPF